MLDLFNSTDGWQMLRRHRISMRTMQLHRYFFSPEFSNTGFSNVGVASM